MKTTVSVSDVSSKVKRKPDALCRMCSHGQGVILMDVL